LSQVYDVTFATQNIDEYSRIDSLKLYCYPTRLAAVLLRKHRMTVSATTKETQGPSKAFN